MNFKGIFWMILLVSLIISIGFVSATDVNDTNTDIITQSSEIDLTDINEEDNLEISQENQISSQENSHVIYVGQNKTTDGGNGTPENPFESFELACNNLSGEEKVEINVYNGTYYLDSDLKFNTSNLLINGMGDVLIKNLRNEPGACASFGLTSSNGNFTFSNLIFDASNCNELSLVTTKPHFNVFRGLANLGEFYNCTFTGYSDAIMFTNDYSKKFSYCKFMNTTSTFFFDYTLANSNVVMEFDYCIFSCSYEYFCFGRVQLDENNNGPTIIFNNVWFGSNTKPNYLSIGAYDNKGYHVGFQGLRINRYAKFSAYENYLGNDTYELVGKLIWNDGSIDGLDKLESMLVEISSKTGQVNKTVTLENGTFKTIYKSKSKDNHIEIDLDFEEVILEFKNDIQVVANPIYYGDEQIITIIIPQLTNCNINVTVNNKTYNVSTNGMTSFNFTVPDQLSAGEYQVDVKLVDVNNHLYGMDSTNWTISKINKNMIITTPAGGCINDESITINVQLANDASGNITVHVGDKNITKECFGKNTEINIASLLNKGENEVKIVYSGNKKYASQSKEEKIFVNGLYPNMNITVPENLKMENEINITIYLPQQASGNITVSVGDKNLTINNISKENTINIANLLIAGYNTVSIKYSGDHIWNSQIKKETIHVSKLTPIMSVNATNIVKVSEDAVINVTLPKDASGNISIEFNGKKEIFNLNEIINISNLILGNNTINITYSGDDRYCSCSLVVGVAVERWNVSFVDVSVVNGTSPVFSVCLPEDVAGNVSVDVGGNVYSLVLVNGSGDLQVFGLVPGVYSANVSFDGDGKYCSCSLVVGVAVERWNVSFVDVSVVNGTSPVFSVCLPEDVAGNVSVDVAGNVYSLVLVNGSGDLQIFDLYPGNYNTKISFNGDNKYNAFSKNLMFNVPKPVLKANDITMIYTSDTKFSVQVLANDKPVIGKTVTLTINGKKIMTNTNNKGYASVKINLVPKSTKYTVITEYQGVKTKNYIKVNSIIQAKNVKVKKSAKILKIKVSLKKINNKYLKGKKITLKFKSKKYIAKTNKKGVATFKINKNVIKKLKKGKKYKYQVIYLKDIINKKVIVKK